MTKNDTASSSGDYKQYCPSPARCASVVVLLISLLLTGVVWRYVERNDLLVRQAIFERETQAALEKVARRTEKFESVLNGVRGLFAASHSVEPEEFRAYVESIDLPHYDPSIRGLAYISRVERGNVINAIKAATRATSRKTPDRTLAPAVDVPEAGIEHFSMVYLEPADAWDSGMLGFDISMDSIQRAALERARDNSASMALGRLLEASSKREGPFPLKDLFVYRAIYKNGIPATTEAERETALEGFIIAKVSTDSLFQELFAKEYVNLIDCEAHIGDKCREQDLLFRLSDSIPSMAEQSVFDETCVIRTEGTSWTLRFRSRSGFFTETERTDAIVVALVGALISFLLFGITWMMATAQSRAMTLAKKITADLSASEERCRTLIENVPGAIYRSANDPQWTMEFISDDIEEITGYPASDFIDNKIRSFASIIHPEDSKLVDKVVQDGIAIRKPFIIEYRVIASAGSVKWVYQKGQGIFGSGGHSSQLLHIDGAVFDVTNRKQLEEQLFQAQKMESVGQLAGGVAHDFNNILMVMHFHAQRVHDFLPADHPMVPVVEVIQKSARRATELTQQLLAFSRRQIMHIVPLHINSVVSNTLRMLRPLLGTNIRIVSNLAPDLAPVHADHGLIGQVIVNLAVNARDAMPQGGTLTIETGGVTVSTALHYHNGDAIPPGEYVVLSIGDTGTGISAANAAHIFEPFFTTKPIGKGTGLGLAVVYGIVKQHEGGTLLETSPQGSTFRIYLPAMKEPHGPVEDISEASMSAPPSREIVNGAGDRGRDPGGRTQGAGPSRFPASRFPLPASGVEAAPPGASGKAETILLVEDDEAVREISAEILKGAGYTVLTAAEGIAALKLCDEHSGPIHLLFTDIMLPEISGNQLAMRISRLRPEMKVLYTSGYADDVIVRHGISRTSMNFIPKPFSEKDLLWKIREVIGP